MDSSAVSPLKIGSTPSLETTDEMPESSSIEPRTGPAAGSAVAPATTETSLPAGDPNAGQIPLVDTPPSPQFSLTCYISRVWVDIWTQNKVPPLLCFGTPIQDRLKYVILKAQAIIPAAPIILSSATVVPPSTTPNSEDIPSPAQWLAVSLKWSSDYEIAVCDTAFTTSRNLNTITTAAQQRIDLGDRYTASWSTKTNQWISQEPEEDSKSPGGGFRFQNTNRAAACVIFRTSEGQQKKPFYISPVLLPPSGKGGNSVTFRNSLVVWFDRDPKVTEGQMVINTPAVTLSKAKENKSHTSTPTSTKNSTSSDEAKSLITRIPITQKFQVPLIRQDMVVHYDEEGYWQSGPPRPPEMEELVEL